MMTMVMMWWDVVRVVGGVVAPMLLVSSIFRLWLVDVVATSPPASRQWLLSGVDANLDRERCNENFQHEQRAGKLNL